MLSKMGMLTFVANCEDCPEQHVTDEDDFFSALAEIKREGWRVTKDETDNWIHLCPNCA